MLKNTNITNLKDHPPQAQPAITLDSVAEAMKNWRENKRNPGEKIPDTIWQQIFVLLERFPESMLRAALAISTNQFQQKLAQYKRETHAPAAPGISPIEFCEVKQAPLPPKKKQHLYQSIKIPATNTLVVEFCRSSDGQIMKIHTTTDSFAELMRAFFVGD